MTEKSPFTRDRNLFGVHWKVDPARREEFLQLFEQVCEEAKPFYYRGCTFAFQGWARDPNEFVVFASWDEEVAQELRNVPEFQENNRKLLECCTEPVQMEWYSGMNKDRAIFDAFPVGTSSAHKFGDTNPFITR
ncbi:MULTISPECIES: putative quinol monooxygenase [Sphingobium]|uniref:putative quinol monooxygenase n=1 Tax=Sphingobium TaxID=165695 RepID=UPI00159C7C48|nr:hypothetical protein [Sphingobium sp. 15-1]